MTFNEFIWKVAEMRDAQKHYLESRNQRVLKVACKLERIIDHQLDVFRKVFDTYSEDGIEIIIKLMVKEKEINEINDELLDD